MMKMKTLLIWAACAVSFLAIAVPIPTDRRITTVKGEKRGHSVSRGELSGCKSGIVFRWMIVGIVLLFFVRVESPLMRVIVRIALLPVIAGISYELIKWAGSSENPVVCILSKPGLWLQGLTTKEPDDEMIEVGIASVEAVFDWKAYLRENFGYKEEE